jgi:hypothetical protein
VLAYRNATGVTCGRAAQEVDMEIVVEVGEQMNGATFSLSPKTRAYFRSSGYSLPGVSNLFVSNDTRKAFEQMYGPMAPQIVSILTGLPEAEILRSGYSFVDPTTEHVLFGFSAAA